MKMKGFAFVVSVLSNSNVACEFYAQEKRANYHKVTSNLFLDAELAPFYHGVASGDPTSESVIIWTKVTTADFDVDDENITVSWEISENALFEKVTNSGTAVTDPYKDYTVKVDVKELSSYRHYYYRFTYDGTHSMIGRTKTAPSIKDDDGIDVQQLRFATVSCSNLLEGHFNAYDRIVERNDLDAVIHLGDYIYEVGGEGHEPPHELLTLEDYRARYSQYRLNPSLRSVHQQYPFLTVWDDHEIADNGWEAGAAAHDPHEGNWTERLRIGTKVYDEWMPIRLPDPSNPGKIYRKLNYGDLVDIFFLDTRFEGRDKQHAAPFSYAGIVDFQWNGYTNPNQELLSTQQREWLYQGLLASSTQWKIIAQQTLMSPLRLFNIALNMDAWDGYVAERQNLLQYLCDNNIDNVVVVTGDIHTAIASDLPLTFYNPLTGTRSAAVEFVTGPVSSIGLELALEIILNTTGIPQSIVQKIFELNNLHAKFIQFGAGYSVLDLNEARAQNDYYLTGPRETLNDVETYTASFLTRTGENHVERGENGESSMTSFAADPAPTSDGKLRRNLLKQYNIA